MIASTFCVVPCLIEVALTHFPIVGDAGVCGSVDHARRRGHGQEVAAVVVVAAASAPVAGGVGRHLEVPRREGKAAHAHTHARTTLRMHYCPCNRSLSHLWADWGGSEGAAAALSVCTGWLSFSKEIF